MEVGPRRDERYRGPGQAIRDRRSWAPDEVHVGQLGPSADRAESLGETTNEMSSESIAVSDAVSEWTEQPRGQRVEDGELAGGKVGVWCLFWRVGCCPRHSTPFYGVDPRTSCC